MLVALRTFEYYREMRIKTTNRIKNIDNTIRISLNSISRFLFPKLLSTLFPRLSDQLCKTLRLCKTSEPVWNCDTSTGFDVSIER